MTDGITVEFLLGDQGYGSNDLLEFASESCRKLPIPSKRNRKEKLRHGKDLYRARNLIENVFLHLKVTRHAKTSLLKLVGIGSD